MLKPDYETLFNSVSLSKDAEAKFRKVLSNLGFNPDTLGINSMQTGRDSWNHYEIMLPHKTYTLSLLTNMERVVRSAVGHEFQLTFKARKVGTLLCFEFYQSA